MPNIHEIITSRMIELLEAGTAPWQKPWASRAPVNLISQKTLPRFECHFAGVTRICKRVLADV